MTGLTEAHTKSFMSFLTRKLVGGHCHIMSINSWSTFMEVEYQYMLMVLYFTPGQILAEFPFFKGSKTNPSLSGNSQPGGKNQATVPYRKLL